jgi:hypothetical protein
MPAMTREGDAVCLLSGCEVPLILRDNSGGSGWSSVGEAYVHGIMDGEAMRMVEEGVLGERDFEARGVGRGGLAWEEVKSEICHRACVLETRSTMMGWFMTVSRKSLSINGTRCLF